MAMVVAGALVLTTAFSVAVARALTAGPDRIPAGVSIAGVAVGGLTPKEARRALIAGAAAPRGAVALRTSRDPAFSIDVPMTVLAPRPRIDDAVSGALSERTFATSLLGELGIPRGRDIPLEWQVDRPRTNAVVARAAKDLDRAPRSARVLVRGRTIEVRPARRGRGVDRPALVRAIAQLPEVVEVPLRTRAPDVTTAEARAAARRARRIADRPVRLTAGKKQATLTPPVLRRALRVRERGGALQVALDGAEIADAVSGPFGPLLREPRSAGFRVTGERVVVVPGRTGRRLDGVAIAAALTRNPDARTMRARFTESSPRRTTDEARALRIRELVGEFTTEFPCCEPRVTNIRLAARILDGTIVPPQGTFSLNETLGERTAGRGFVAAPQINAGRLEDAIGGGVSQIATTLFNAAWFSGMHLESHTPHEFYISRYPPGREATVSWGGPELVFKNDWPAGVLIRARTTETSVTFRMYSSRLGRRVETRMGSSPGGGAFTIEYGRRVYRGDALKERNDFSWSYRAPPP